MNQFWGAEWAQTYHMRFLYYSKADMSNSIAVPLVLLFLKVLPLPLIIAYVDLEQLVLQLILVSSNNYWLLEHCYWSLGNWKYCYCNWYWNCTEKRIGIGIAIGIVLHKQLVLVLPLILHSKNNWYWYCNWYCIPQTIDIGIAIDIAFQKQLLLLLPLLMMSNHAFYQKVSNKETVDIDITFVIQAGFSLVHLFSESKRPLCRNFSKGPSRKDFWVGSNLPPDI